jgi:hypothetical protein
MGEYERMAIRHLRQIYQGEEVDCEWYAFRGEGGEFYSPRVDIAVGPFAFHDHYGERYGQLLVQQRGFIDRLMDAHNGNVPDPERVAFNQIARFNENARCLLCIESRTVEGESTASATS